MEKDTHQTQTIPSLECDRSEARCFLVDRVEKSLENLQWGQHTVTI